MPAPEGVRGPRLRLHRGLAGLAAAGAALLAAATFLAVIEIAVGGTSKLAPGSDTRLTGWERHGPALLLLGAFAAALTVGAARRARPAMAALAACGLTALVLVLVADLPDLDETGLIGALYADAEANPGPGWYAETAGAVLLVLAGSGLLLASARGEAAPRAAAAGGGRRALPASGRAAKPAGHAKPAGRAKPPAGARRGAELARVRSHCLSLPETSERLSHGAPTFFIREKRAFVTFHDDHHGDGRLALWCAAPEGAQAGLVAAAPDRYFIPAYVASRGWVGVRLDRDIPWDEIAGVIEDAYLTRAPKTLIAALRGEHDDPARTGAGAPRRPYQR